MNAKKELISLLIDMDMTFGQRSKTTYISPPVFSMYGPFDDFSDPMFPVNFITII